MLLNPVLYAIYMKLRKRWIHADGIVFLSLYHFLKYCYFEYLVALADVLSTMPSKLHVSPGQRMSLGYRSSVCTAYKLAGRHTCRRFSVHREYSCKCRHTIGVEVRLGKLSLLVLRVSLTANQGMRQSCLILMWTCGCMP